LIHDKIYPDFLAAGYTPGIFSSIAAPMADFGIWFLILVAIVKGAFIAMLYFYFLKSKSFILLVLYISIFDLTFLLLLLPIMFTFFRKNNY